MKLPNKKVVWITICLLAACATAVNLVQDKSKPHHTESGFRNNYITGLNNGGGQFWKWQFERIRDGLPKPPENGYRFPLVKPDSAWLKANRSEVTATWIGHATVLMQVGGRQHPDRSPPDRAGLAGVICRPQAICTPGAGFCRIAAH